MENENEKTTKNTVELVLYLDKSKFRPGKETFSCNPDLGRVTRCMCARVDGWAGLTGGGGGGGEEGRR